VPATVVTVIATVDSGASKSFFPKQIAYRLGIQDAELAQDPGQSQGVGSVFTTWSSTVPIRANIIAYLTGAAGPQIWGPQINLDPAFSEHDAFLLGREDFFRPFIVTFEVESIGMPVFHIDA
jgi:hypothetical protein